MPKLLPTIFVQYVAFSAHMVGANQRRHHTLFLSKTAFYMVFTQAQEKKFFTNHNPKFLYLSVPWCTSKFLTYMIMWACKLLRKQIKVVKGSQFYCVHMDKWCSSRKTCLLYTQANQGTYQGKLARLCGLYSSLCQVEYLKPQFLNIEFLSSSLHMEQSCFQVLSLCTSSCSQSPSFWVFC